jgi:8-oxo-dGTP pyrophosphatase MutT (NUDIX family)
VGTDFFLGGEGRLRPADAAVALIVVDGTGYLMQLRDQKSGIFYPGHWGLFGGALDVGEAPETTLHRELNEELGLVTTVTTYFSELSLDFSFGGFGRVTRSYYEVPITSSDIAGLVLGEGSDMRSFSASEILSMTRVVPYDAVAIWMHATRYSVWSGEVEPGGAS